MTLKVVYNRKDFFNNTTITEDIKQDFAKNDLVKAFLLFSKKREVVIQVENILMFWGSKDNFENRKVVVVTDDGMRHGVIMFEALKKEWYKKFTQNKVS